MAVLESKEISTINALIDRIFAYNPDADFNLLRRAYAFSKEVHNKQKRLEGAPFIEHPLAVAAILTNMSMDSTTIAAGLLHDTIEDTDTKIEEIRELFGQEVAFLVESLTKLSKMEFRTSAEAYAENFRKIFIAMAKDIRVILIKFADRLHNLRTLEYLPEDKRKKIARETLEIYAPLANRLGIGWLKTEFEDLSFKFLEPNIYNELVYKVAKRREEQENYINELIKIIEQNLKEASIYGKVFGRVKHYYGIYQKMQKQGIPFEEIYDVLALRIITDTKANCYAILGLIHSLWTPVPGRFKDYIGAPKSNMYQSLHTTVIGPKGEKVEFQIRTHEMDKIAEEGIAAHWKYKEHGTRIDEKDDKYFSWLRDMIQAQREMPDAKEFLEAVKGNIFLDTVYVFTPKGDVIELPSGSTPVDFAYSIHTEIGHQCTGAKVNGKLVPLRYKLEHGDTVEILTSPGHHPSRDWLKFVKTQKAKSRIKQWVKVEERKKALDLGRELLERALRKNGLTLELMNSKEIIEAASPLRIKDHEDLLIAIGYGKLSVHHLVNKLLPEHKKVKKPSLREPKRAMIESGIRIKGVDNIMFHRSKCCYPLPGEEVVGFVTRGRGVSIHTSDCPNLESLTIDNDRLVEVEWEEKNDSNSTYLARISALTIDKKGLLADMSAVISANGININHIDASTTRDKQAHFNFILEVKNIHQLNDIMKKLSQISGVIEVKRVKTT
jgi:GTP pyrophosphokinase